MRNLNRWADENPVAAVVYTLLAIAAWWLVIAFFLPVGTTTPLNNIILAVGWVLIIAGLVVFIVMPLRWTRTWWRIAGCLLIEVAAFLLIMLITGMILGARAGMFG